MTAPEQSKSGEGWWWAWRAWLGLTLAWLGACLSLGRTPAAWTHGWVGWWTGDRMGAGMVRSVQPHLDMGAEIARAEGNPAFRTTVGFVLLGNWQERRIPWTWAGWVRVNIASGKWPTNYLSVRLASKPGSVFHLGFLEGKARASLEMDDAASAPYPGVNLQSQAADTAPIGRWMHLACSTDGTLLRIVLDGRTVAEQSWVGAHREVLYLASLRLRSVLEGEEILSKRTDALSVEQDDVVLYERVVPPEELAALAARGRGAWAAELDRGERAQRLWRRGWPSALLALALMLTLQVRPQSRNWLVAAAQTFALPTARPVRWVLLCGALITVVLTTALLRHARQSDKVRFTELTSRLEGETDLYWEKVAAFLMRARDWVAAQPHVSQDRWEAWLKSNHFPHDHRGVLGLGYAEQVLPGNLGSHESQTSHRHGFAYRVQPAPGPEREVVGKLEGNPLLPVVLYGPRELSRDLWFTNQSILGLDLLYRRKNDPRPWCEGRRVESAVVHDEVTPSALETIAPTGWYGDAIDGVRLYVPWTLPTKVGRRFDAPLESAGWRGVFFANVDLRGLLRDRYGGGGAMIGCRFTEGGLGGELYETLADTGSLLPETADRSDAMLREQLKIKFYHRKLYVDVWTTRAFEALSFRRWAWIAGACSGGLTLLSATLLLVQARARTRQQRVLDALSAANSELLLTYREREELSRDLHDGSIQNLYALGLHLQRVRQLFDTTPARARDGLKDSLEMLNQSIAELRQFILSAGVDNLQQSTVPGALETFVERLRKTTTVEVQLRVDPAATALAPRLGVQVLNVVREAVSNALRHAAPRRIDIRLEPAPSGDQGSARWRLEVTDDGNGFDPTQANGNGHGLKNLSARASELRGTSRLDSTPGGGTRVTLDFPS